MENINHIERRVKIWLSIFITGLILSGLTAFPLETELKLLNDWSIENIPESNQLLNWITLVYEAIQKTNYNYPFMAYGTDWLAFSHIVIGIFFIGVFREPIRNRWVIHAGMIACLAVIPLAMIAGSVRGIPMYWRIIDCSFGVFGIIPLFLIDRQIQKLIFLKEEFQNNQLYKKQKEVLA